MLLHIPYCVTELSDWLRLWETSTRVRPTHSYGDAEIRVSQKPLVEKLRRERINSCIEQLRSLLSPEFLKQQPDSKLDKADILEMTVCFLIQLQHSSGPVNTNTQSLFIFLFYVFNYSKHLKNNCKTDI
uniref:BHLH domain-containing protein n=1 Tax=Amphilophus citrinellus TaxID=61819 RepID=A0A3Q0S1P8_AMPCI